MVVLLSASRFRSGAEEGAGAAVIEGGVRGDQGSGSLVEVDVEPWPEGARRGVQLVGAGAAAPAPVIDPPQQRLQRGDHLGRGERAVTCTLGEHLADQLTGPG